MNDLAELFHKLTYGVYVVGVAHAEKRNAFTAVWIMQVSFDPLLVALSINPTHASYPLLRDGGGFTINVLQQGQLELARHFGTLSAREQDKLAGILWRPGLRGAPILKEAMAYFDCDLVDNLQAGDHQVVLGRVMEGQILVRDAIPLTYAETGDMDGSSALYPNELG